MRSSTSRRQVEALREKFLAQADKAFGRMFGQDGQNGLVTFTEREDRACEMGDGLTRWLLKEHVGLDAAGDPGVEVACPICGGPVRSEAPERAKLEVRKVQTRRGEISYERAARRCPRCRKVFFPT